MCAGNPHLVAKPAKGGDNDTAPRRVACQELIGENGKGFARETKSLICVRTYAAKNPKTSLSARGNAKRKEKDCSTKALHENVLLGIVNGLYVFVGFCI